MLQVGGDDVDGSCVAPYHSGTSPDRSDFISWLTIYRQKPPIDALRRDPTQAVFRAHRRSWSDAGVVRGVAGNDPTSESYCSDE
jgi:hypothetical protein